MPIRKSVSLAIALFLFVGCAQQESESTVSNVPKELALIQHGKMRKVIGLQQHEGRILLTDAIQESHLYAVGALEGLTGEVTILDGKVRATESPKSDSLVPLDSIADRSATLLVGFHIDQWNKQTIAVDVKPDELEEYIEGKAKDLGIDTSKPFPFVIEGTLTDLHLHVIRGACPVHSKRNGIELDEDSRPYHGNHDSLKGTLVGVYAIDAAGNLTHPGTSTHTHVVYSQQDAHLTGHVESVGVASDATLLLPKI